MPGSTDRAAEPVTQFTVAEILPSYWWITFENGPVNLVDPDSIEQLGRLIGRIEESPRLTVVVFDSANPEYFMAHWDLRADRARVAAMAPGPTGLHPYADNLVRLAKIPAVTISAIRGRARGAGSEFVLATDIRFTGQRAILGQIRGGRRSGPRRRLDGPAGRPWPGRRDRPGCRRPAGRPRGTLRVREPGTSGRRPWRVRGRLFDNGLQTPTGVEQDLGRAVGDFARLLDATEPDAPG
ncbi:MAG TPA: enoyl-CoA hydratase/isomerase family protein [Mycobacteriales bacterium]|nr:enoyl-CoA hydratase/isomerase family protein [Mycobacteriales bacterium]